MRCTQGHICRNETAQVECVLHAIEIVTELLLASKAKNLANSLHVTIFNNPPREVDHQLEFLLVASGQRVFDSTASVFILCLSCIKMGVLSTK